MPVATSPYQQNDYKAASNYRPYDLPINDIYKSIDTQNKFWRAGADNIKRVYESALNLDLTTDQNIELRKNYMEKAQKELTKLSTMDVSDPSVQRQGFGLFKPLLTDKGIMYDDYITKQYKDVISEAEKWKNDEKTKGEKYHLDNLAYGLRPFKGFNRNTTREQLEGIYNVSKDASYTPYYDQSKERLDILDKCKPDISSKTTIQGMYTSTEKITKLSSQKLWGCLKGGLSDAANQQTRISGAVRYNDDYDTLKKEYLATAQDNMEYYDGQIKDLSVQRATYAGKKGYETLVKGIDDQIAMYKKGIGDYSDRLKEYNTWDDDYMKKNYDDLAYEAYFKRANGAFADAFARQEVYQDLKADPVGMMYYVQKKLDDRAAADRIADKELEQYKAGLKLLSGEGDLDEATRMKLAIKWKIPLDDIQTAMGTAEEEKATSYGVLKESIDNANVSIEKQAIELKQEVEGIADLSKTVQNVTDSKSFNTVIGDLEKYVQGRLKADEYDSQAIRIRDGLNNYRQLLNEKIHRQSILEDAQSTVEKRSGTLKQNYEKLRADFEKTNVTNFTAVGSNAPKYNSRELFDIITGTNPNFTITKLPSITGGFKIRITDKRSGEMIAFDDQGGTGTPNNSMFGPSAQHVIKKLYEDVNKEATNYTGAVNDVLGERTAVQRMKIISGNLLGKGKTDVDAGKMTPPMKFVSDVFGTQLGDVHFNTRGGFDPVTGWTDIEAIYDTGSNKGKSVPKDELMDVAKKSGYGNAILDDSKFENGVRLRIDYLKDIVKAPQYNETLGGLLHYNEKKVQSENIPQGLVMEAGIAPTGETVQVRTRKSLGSGGAEHSIIIGGVESPIRGGNNASVVLAYIDNILTGKGNEEIKKTQK